MDIHHRWFGQTGSRFSVDLMRVGYSIRSCSQRTRLSGKRCGDLVLLSSSRSVKGGHRNVGGRFRTQSSLSVHGGG